MSKIENLGALLHLKKLDLGKNKIQHIEGLELLSSLVQLSLEDNEIESLSGLAKGKYRFRLAVIHCNSAQCITAAVTRAKGIYRVRHAVIH